MTCTVEYLYRINIDCTDHILSCHAGTPAHCHFDTTNYWYISLLCASVLVPVRMLLYEKQMVVSLNPPLCYVSLTAMLCVRQELLSLWQSLPLEQVSSLSVFSPPLRTSEGSLSTPPLFCHTLKHQTVFFLHFHLDRSFTPCSCFVCPLFILPLILSLFLVGTLALQH